MLVTEHEPFAGGAALIIMHYQEDVFSILFDGGSPPILSRCNALIESWRGTDWPVIFANVSLGANHQHAPPASNRQLRPYVSSHHFRSANPVKGLAIEPGDEFYVGPRASIFFGTSLHSDLQARNLRTLVMAGISTTGVVLSSVAWACDADYDVRLVKDCCFDPDTDAHEALFRSGFGGRAAVL